MLNTIYIGVETDILIRSRLQKPGFGFFEVEYGKSDEYERVMFYGDLFFTSAFTIELCLRAYSGGWLFFFRGSERNWNIFDTLVIGISIVEIFVNFFGQNLYEANTLGALRTLRIIRVFRILRFADSFRIVRHLQTMLYSLWGCISSFLPGFSLFVSVMYVFTLLILNGIIGFLNRSYPEGTEQIADERQIANIQTHFGSVLVTLFTMLASVCGGNDWIVYSNILQGIGWPYVCLFLLYIVVVLLGLMNVLTGIFVHVATQSAQMAKEIAIDFALRQKGQLVHEMVNAFMAADQDNDGLLTWEEFHNYISDENIKAYFMSLDIDLSCAWKIFDLLDAEDTGLVGLEDFVSGCLHFRGGAKAVDIAILADHINQIVEHLGDDSPEGKAFKAQMSSKKAFGPIDTSKELSEVLHSITSTRTDSPKQGRK